MDNCGYFENKKECKIGNLKEEAKDEIGAHGEELVLSCLVLSRLDQLIQRNFLLSPLIGLSYTCLSLFSVMKALIKDI